MKYFGQTLRLIMSNVFGAAKQSDRAGLFSKSLSLSGKSFFLCSSPRYFLGNFPAWLSHEQTVSEDWYGVQHFLVKDLIWALAGTITTVP